MSSEKVVRRQGDGIYILALNCGSATVKLKLFAASSGELRSIHADRVEVRGGYRQAVEAGLSRLPREPTAVVHRVVHGGERFVEPTLLDESVLSELKLMSEFAPLHNPPALDGIEATQRLGVPMVAVFDTAFHSTLPAEAGTYAISAEVAARHGLRRYGFHGLSHAYVTERIAVITATPRPTLVSLHLGNGCSATAVRTGRSVDTSMGFSPTEGLVMGTRPGDMDPWVVVHLLRRGWSVDAIESLLTRESGLSGLAGTSDMRELLARNDTAARAAVALFCYRAIKYLGAYFVVLGGPQTLAFAGGIGENAPEIRRRIVTGLEWAGFVLDDHRNQVGDERISGDSSRVGVYVIRTDEEGMMVREAVRVLGLV